MIRTVIQINEEKCNGCGLCANACHEGAIEIIGGKAKLTRDDYCDGFGDCLPSCPTGAITFIEREAAAYDEAAVKANMERKQSMLNAANGNIEGGRATSPAAHAHAPPCGRLSWFGHTLVRSREIDHAGTVRDRGWRPGAGPRSPGARRLVPQAVRAGQLACANQACAHAGSVFPWRESAHCRRLLRLCLWQLPCRVHAQQGGAHRMPQARRRGLRR